MLIDVLKIAVLYLATLLSFTLVKNKKIRIALSITILASAIFLFKLNYKMALFAVFLGFGGAVTESIFIRYISDTWIYLTPDFASVPYWLVPLWSIAAILIWKSICVFKGLCILV